MVHFFFFKMKKVSSWPGDCIVSSVNFNQRQHCTINVLRAASCNNQGGFKKQVWVIPNFFPPPCRSQNWKSGWGPCVASGCPSHKPSAMTKRRLRTSSMRTAAGMGRPEGGEPAEGRGVGDGPGGGVTVRKWWCISRDAAVSGDWI